jgi:hypothetical protein
MRESEAMRNGKELLSDELLHDVEQVARAQKREPAEVLEEAVRKYLQVQRLKTFAERAERRARARGIRGKDVPRLVAEVRREDRQRGR